MGVYSDLDSGQGGGGSFRQMDGQSPAPKPKAPGGDPRKSQDYADMMAAAKRTNDATDATLNNMGWLGKRAAQAYDQGVGALSGLPFAGDIAGFGAKGGAIASNAISGLTGGREIDPDAAFAA